MNPKVSILIPTYNRAVFLQEAIRSALNQTYQNTEIVILDDASPDNTTEVVAEFLTSPNVRYIRHEQNLGIVGNWSAGFQSANGDFLCLLHDDDTFEPAFLEELLRPHLSDPELTLSFCDHWVVNEHGERLCTDTENASHYFGRSELLEGKLEDFARTALIRGSIPVGASLFRTSAVRNMPLNTEAKGSIDFWLFYQCVRNSGTAYYVPQRLMNYRLHAGGMTWSQRQYMVEGKIVRHRSILADAQMKELHQETLANLGGDLTTLGIDLLRKGDRRSARENLVEALRLNRTRRAMIAYFLTFGGSTGTKLSNKIRNG